MWLSRLCSRNHAAIRAFRGFTYAQESFILLAQRDRRIVEVPLTMRRVREKGNSRIAMRTYLDRSE
jgi:hypothetical protein